MTRVLTQHAGVFVALVVVAGALSPAARAQSPDKAQIAAALAAAHARYASLEEGKNADYIPALAKVPSRLFVIALVTVDGEVHTIGDVDQLFSIQSISKVFTLAEVLQERGGAAIEGSVGVDATGQVFNSIVAVEQYKGHEMNSFVNAGAIATTSLVHGANEKDIWAKIIGVHSGRSG